MRSKAPRTDKVEVVDTLSTVYKESKALILTDYRGMTVKDINALRAKLRDAGGEYHVVKNTLFKRVLGDTLTPELDKVLEGPTAIAFATNDAVATTKAVLDYFRTLRKPEVQLKGGFVDGRVLTPEQMTDFSKLPPKDVILAQALGTIQAPLNNFAGTLNGVLSEFARTLQALADKQQEAA